MKKGERYIIEISEIHTHYDENGKPYPLARIKGFATLVFDQNGLNRLDKFEQNPKFEEFIEAYEGITTLYNAGTIDEEGAVKLDEQLLKTIIETFRKGQ